MFNAEVLPSPLVAERLLSAAEVRSRSMGEMEGALVVLQNIHKNFPDGDNVQKVLQGVNLQVKSSEFVAIQGESGVGKTTLLRILGTLLKPDSGQYLLDGVDVFSEGIDLAQIRNQKIGFVFQDHRLLPQFTALENILLPTLAQKKQSTDAEIEYAHQLMELTGIAPMAAKYPSMLSGGEAGRVAICRALIRKPKLLLADEPTGQLDAQNARNIAQLLADLNQKLGTTILMATHSEEVARVANVGFKL
ncbi:MAG: ABC transporter ATP-binding protein [Mangrovibacterium sp.]